MDSRRVPALFALVGVVVAVVLFLVLKDDTADEDTTISETSPAQTAGTAGDRPHEPERGGGEGSPAEPELPLIEVRGGEPVGGVQELEFESGEEAAFEVRSDVADELHFHGYDLDIDVPAGKLRKVAFEADIEGAFELESHTTGELLAEISVVP